MLGKHIRDVLGESAYAQIQDRVEAALSGQYVTYEEKITYNQASPRWISAVYNPQIEDGEVKGMVVLVSDISDRKAIEQMKDEFISIVSHELRTPLTSIHGSLKLLATGRLGDFSSEGQEMLRVADDNTARMVRLVNDIFDLERLSSGQVKMKLDTCDAAQLMQEAAKRYRKQRNSRKLRSR